jgi:hypothetical protein
MNEMEWWNFTIGGSGSAWRSACSRATLSTANYAWNDLVLNLRLRGESSATGTAYGVNEAKVNSFAPVA